MEQTYEDDMLLNYIDENIKIIKKANLKYQALYNQFIIRTYLNKKNFTCFLIN